MTVSASPAVDARTLWLLSICSFTSMAAMRVCDAMLPALGEFFSVSPGQAAAAIAGFALAYGLMQLIYGPLGDRFGKARVVGLATLACSIGSIVATTAGTLDMLILGRVLTGMAAAGIIPLAMAWIGDTVTYAQRQEVLARLLSATVLGMISGQWLGGLMTEAWGWRAALALLTALFLLSGLALCRQAYRQPRTPTVLTGNAWQRMMLVFRTPWARVILVVVSLEGALVFSALVFIPSHLHLSFDLSMPAAGGIAALYGVGGLIYSRSARMLLQRLGEGGLALTGGGSLAIAYGVVAWAPSWHWVAAACLLAGFGFYTLHNTLQTHATQMVPSVRGTAVSLFAGVLFLGQSLGVQLAAWSLDVMPLRWWFALCAAGLLALGGAFAWLLQHRQPSPVCPG